MRSLVPVLIAATALAATPAVAKEKLAPEAQLLGLSNPLVDSLVRNGGLITATKAALEVYVRHLAWELGPRGHRVNLLKFGAVVTPAMNQTFSGEAGDELQRVLPRVIPAGRVCTVEEVARFIAVQTHDFDPTGYTAWLGGLLYCGFLAGLAGAALERLRD